MFWRAEGLGCIVMLFDFGLLTSKLCLGFSLEKQKKNNLFGQNQKQMFWLQAHFLLKSLKKHMYRKLKQTLDTCCQGLFLLPVNVWQIQQT